MKRIALTRGKRAIVDDYDYDWLRQWNWWAYTRRHTFYAARTVRGSTMHMHRFILGLEIGDKRITDHVNGNGLDNRRKNLRRVTVQQNNSNRVRLRCDNTSGCTGVVRHQGRWRVQICVNGKCYHVGCFTNKKKAISARREAAKKYFGEFAHA